MPIHRKHYPDIQTLVVSFADYVTAILSHTLSKQPRATLVLPGGNTPRYFLPELAKCPLPWHKVSITLSDERWVETYDQSSNERLIREHLLANLPDGVNLVGLKTQHHSPSEAIDEITRRLKTLHYPFSLTVLGLGEDGHIASLFPRIDTQKQETKHYCIAVDQSCAPTDRISLSLSLLANSEHIALVVVGKQKSRLLDQVSTSKNTNLPIAWLIQRCNCPITIFETIDSK